MSHIILNSIDKSETAEYWYLTKMKPSEKIKCQEVVRSGQEPSYGFLIDQHHSLCWRYWRSVKLSQELEDKDSKESLIQLIFDKNNLK